jgi:hypothetical protein
MDQKMHEQETMNNARGKVQRSLGYVTCALAVRIVVRT